MSLKTAERLGVDPETMTVQVVGTPKLDVNLLRGGRTPHLILPDRSDTGKMTVHQGHSLYDKLQRVLSAPGSFGLQTRKVAGGNGANMNGWFTSLGAQSDLHAFYDPTHLTAQNYASLAGNYGVRLRPVTVPDKPVDTNLIVRHPNDRQIFRYAPPEIVPGPERLEELAQRLKEERHLVIATSAGALATHVAIEATPHDTLLAYTPGRELDDPHSMQGIGAALHRRQEQGGRTLVSLNLQEGHQLTGLLGADALTVAKTIGHSGLAQLAYVTDGPQPSVMGYFSGSTELGAVFEPPATEVTGTTTGAGDRGAAFVALRAAVTAEWTEGMLHETQVGAYEEVLPVLQVIGAMDDLPYR